MEARHLNRLLLVIPEIDMARDRLVGIPSEMNHWTVAASGEKDKNLRKAKQVITKTLPDWTPLMVDGR